MHKMRLTKLSTTAFAIFSILASQSQNLEITGKIYDESTQEGIPFATINIEGTSIGTCANLQGDFQFKVPQTFGDRKLLISSMGYEMESVNIVRNSKHLSIMLEQSLVQLDEVTIRPISAEDVIRRAVGKFQTNYGQEFSANAYYRQQSLDHDESLLFTEGYMQAYISDFLDDTTTIDQRLLLHVAENNLEQMKFRKKKRDQKLEKAVKKAAKKEIEIDEDSVRRKATKVSIGLITPDLLMDQDPVRQIESFLDSAKLKKFNYQFEKDITYGEKRVTVISFQSRGKVKLVNVGLKGDLKGIIYFDAETDAIIGVDYDSEMAIPAIAKPVLFLAGFGVSNPIMKNKVRYLQVGDHWFPQSIQVDMGLDLTQRYWFKKNEKSKIDLELLMSISNIEMNNPDKIPEEFKFTRKKKFEEQVFPLEDTSWDSVNRIALESIK